LTYPAAALIPKFMNHILEITELLRSGLEVTKKLSKVFL